MKKLVACAIALVSVLALLTSAGAATTTKAIKDMGVVLIINTNLGDKSFCDLSNEGILAAAKEFGFRTKVVELGGDTTRQIPTLTEFAESKDWDLIVCGTYNIRESFQTVAQQFPNKKFILYDAKDDKSLPNVYSVEHLQNEGSFVAGAAAAMLTSSKAPLANSKKIIGFVAGGENTSINDFLVGYIQGALSVDPAIKVLISLAAVALRCARLRTSAATTAKPRPCSPARAASTAAFNARILVWNAMPSIRPMIAAIFCDDSLMSCIAATTCVTAAPVFSAMAVAPLARLLTSVVRPGVRWVSSRYGRNQSERGK